MVRLLTTGGHVNRGSTIILAGGLSSRMGLPKAVLPFGSSTIIERLIDRLGEVSGEIIIVAAPLRDEPFSLDRILKDRLDTPRLVVERDDSAFQGPVGAMRHGMARASSDIVFACSCDLPLLRSEVAVALCAMVEDYDAAIPEIAGRLQVLCAAYRCEPARAAFSAMEAADEQRLTAITGRLNIRRVAESALRPIDPDLLSFFNVNTAEDYAQALRFAARA